MREMRVFARCRWLWAVAALIAAVLSQGLFWVTPVAAQSAPATGDAVIQAMHDRYAKTWYRTLTFTQKTTRRTPADTMAIETWTESALFPGHLRINIQRATGNTVAIYSGDSLFIVKGDSTANRIASRNILLIMGFDVYTQPAERTLAALHAEHYATNSVREDTWEGRPVYVIGAAAGDLRTPQIWVDKERLLYVRSLAPDGRDSTKMSDDRFDNYVKVPHGWLSETVEAYTGGKLIQKEEYSDINTDAKVDPRIFVPPAPKLLQYAVDLTDTAHHTFDVRLTVPPLTEANAVFEFAATAPGTYQTMNIGRFVRDFMAYDSHGAPIGAEHISTNEWRLASPERVHRITYRVLATRDTTVSADPIYPMCGTALDASYALINGQGVFGFPRGMQAVPLTIRLKSPPGWSYGTPLTDSAGVFRAATYDRLVDSPILLGPHLSRTTFDVTGVPVTIVVRSVHNDIQAEQLRVAMGDMLNAAGSFLGKLPVDHYTFLYDFGPVQRISGAWEHSYGSEYVLADLPYTPKYGDQIRSMAAHEFFHVETPLNIHSEIIEHFNFATPVASQHLWLYEGTTEWAAQKMQLVSGLLTLPQYLDVILQKDRADRTTYDTTWSLRKMSLASYSDSGQAQYINIYARGALVAGLLDIKLLEESGGQRGLRELVLDLAKEYGKQRPFPENGLIDTIVARTSPDVRDFFTRYIQGTERPPVKAYYAKLGITLIEDDKGLPVRFEIDPSPTPEQLRLRQAWMGDKARIA